MLVYELEDKNVPEEQVAIRRAADTKRLDRSAVEHRVRVTKKGGGWLRGWCGRLLNIWLLCAIRCCSFY